MDQTSELPLNQNEAEEAYAELNHLRPHHPQ
jgi:hypothetical protein